MKRYLSWVAAVMVAGCLAGCVPTLYPLYYKADLVTEDSLLGEWWLPKADKPWVLSKLQDKEYRLVLPMEEDDVVFVAHVLKIKDKMFIDVCRDNRTAKRQETLWYRWPVHTFFLVRQTAPVLDLAILSPGWLVKYVKENPTALPYLHGEVGQDNLLLTAETGALQEFVLAHLSQFQDFNKLTRKRPAVESDAPAGSKK